MRWNRGKKDKGSKEGGELFFPFRAAPFLHPAKQASGLGKEASKKEKEERWAAAARIDLGTRSEKDATKTRHY